MSAANCDFAAGDRVILRNPPVTVAPGTVVKTGVAKGAKGGDYPVIMVQFATGGPAVRDARDYERWAPWHERKRGL